jgi:hypothetical protein
LFSRIEARRLHDTITDPVALAVMTRRKLTIKSATG